MNKTYNVEYEEAPSGNVTFYNYKEPLMRYRDGHGFVGALVFDTASKKIQCHLCGTWHNVLGNHLHREHAMTADIYKKTVGLNKKTALVNEEVRAKLIEHGKTYGGNRKNLRPGGKHTEATKRKIRETLRENRDELKNLRGTCPEQLIDRLQKRYEELGYTPRTKVELPFYESLMSTYGTMKEACMVAGIPYRSPSSTLKRQPKFSEEETVIAVYSFLSKNGRLPKSRELPNGVENAINRYYGGKQKIYIKALTYDGVYRKQSNAYRYTKDELLDFLRRFEKIHGRRPSYSDSKRGLLPGLSRYSYNFGSWKNALQLAFN